MDMGPKKESKKSKLIGTRPRRSSHKKLRASLKRLELKVAEKKAEMKREKELLREDETKLKEMERECTRMRQAMNLAMEDNLRTQLYLDFVIAALLQYACLGLSVEEDDSLRI